MEESTQRRERLKAMRLEASQVAPSSSDDHSSVSGLSNPFLESTESKAQSLPQSFNYYTNPMAAYSGNRPQISQDYSSTPQSITGSRTNEASPSPSPQPHLNYFPNPQMQQPRGQYPNPNYAAFSPHPHVGFPSPQTHFTRSPSRGSAQGVYPSPHFTNNPGQGSGRGYPSPGPNIPNPGSGGQGGRGQWFRSEMGSGPSSGRGMGRGSGQGWGRGRGGTHSHVSAEGRHDRFYHKSMVEDPWKFLEPVVWKPQKKQWLPQSLSVKKPRVSESPKPSSSQPSLAEILAASFNDAKDDEPNAKPRVSESPKPSSSQPSLAEILAASFNEAKDDEPNAG